MVVTEEEWVACSDPRPMLSLLARKSRVRVSDRKLRLFAIACCRRVSLTDQSARRAVEVAEEYCEGLATADQMACAGAATPLWVTWVTQLPLSALMRIAWTAAQEASGAANGETHLQEVEAQVGLLRDIVGNPFRPHTLNPSLLTWNNEAVVKLAKEMYDANAFKRMPLLGDLLEQGGCGDEEILGHCRGPGPHVKGCYVVDLLLGKA